MAERKHNRLGARLLGWVIVLAIVGLPTAYFWLHEEEIAVVAAPVGRGLTAELQYGAQIYERLKTREIRPRLVTEWRNLALRADYRWVKTTLDQAGSDGGLSSYLLKLTWHATGRIAPWVSYSRTKEAFEAGQSLDVGAFRARHTGIGSAVRFSANTGLVPWGQTGKIGYPARLGSHCVTSWTRTTWRYRTIFTSKMAEDGADTKGFSCGWRRVRRRAIALRFAPGRTIRARPVAVMASTCPMSF